MTNSDELPPRSWYVQTGWHSIPFDQNGNPLMSEPNYFGSPPWLGSTMTWEDYLLVTPRLVVFDDRSHGDGWLWIYYTLDD